MRVFTTALAALLVWLAAHVAALAESRLALVIGNGAYTATTALANPANDARDVALALKKVGFDVIEVVDAGKGAMDRALRSFADRLATADVALFFYAGHGLQVGLQNYLVPVDAKLVRERDLEFEAVRLEFVLRQMEIDREGKTTIVILDACRDNPLSRNLARSMGTRSTAVGQGLAAAATGLGTFIAYSTQPGNVALDGKGRNSPFSAALVRNITVKGRNLPATMIEVRKDVVAATNGRQVPWDHSALTGDFYFLPGTGGATPAASPPAAGNGTSAEVAALQERLRRLEEESRQRQAHAAPRNTTPGLTVERRRPAAAAAGDVAFDLEENVRLEGIRIGEGRKPNPEACRQWCEDENGCVAFQHGRKIPVMGLCQLFLRVDAREPDRAWRSGIRPGTPLPRELAEEARGGPAIRIAAPLTRREAGYDIYEGVTVLGDQIKMSTSDNPAGCRTVCRNTPGCRIAVYNEFFRGKNLACQVYRAAKSTMKAPSSVVMVRAP
ncbi:MAG: caspase family protein [Hyphomicrobiaceae bacterium]